jgi:hypothetical protein
LRGAHPTEWRGADKLKEAMVYPVLVDGRNFFDADAPETKPFRTEDSLLDFWD